MDRRRRRVDGSKSIAAIALISAIAACSAEKAQDLSAPLSVVDLTELNWINSDASALAVLTTQPANCSVSDSVEHEGRIASGEALFNSPLLLGGQAAKAGVSCATCHRNGRDNPNFVFQGVSGEPGTADVSHGLFGKLRDDDQFNPVEIPDLALPAGKQIVFREDSRALTTFLEAQIVEEFDGVPPQEPIISDLVAYLQSLKGDCENNLPEPRSWETEMKRVASVFERQRAIMEADPETASAYVDAGRAALGRLHARYASTEHEQLRGQLVAFSRRLQKGMSAYEFAEAHLALSAELERHARTSLYDRETLQLSLAAR